MPYLYKELSIKIGRWMDAHSKDDIFPTFYSFSSNEKILIRSILNFTEEERINLSLQEIRIIQKNEPCYSWSDLLILPHVLKKVENDTGIIRIQLIRFSQGLRPIHSSIGIFYILNKVQEECNTNLVKMGLSTLDNLYKTLSLEKKKNSSKGGKRSIYEKIKDICEKEWLRWGSDKPNFHKITFANSFIKNFGEINENGKQQPAAKTITNVWIPEWEDKYKKKSVK